MSRGGSRKNWRKDLADLFEMPQDIVLNLPRLTVIGNMQCYLENHRGVIEYTDELVRVAVNGGEISIRGLGLVIRYLANDEIAVDGDITVVNYEY
ncbi:MAG: sporulation protein YqfC [Dethiobacter sp.]|jgi:sporulation protein YqfC|nr:sporulation protein YqfC [Dethiobacter sp.]